jgi:hypothetical protein
LASNRKSCGLQIARTSFNRPQLRAFAHSHVEEPVERLARPAEAVGEVLVPPEHLFDGASADGDAAHGCLRADACGAHVTADEGSLAEDIAWSERSGSLGRLDDHFALLEDE